jgi:hypothetical protein
MDPRHRAEMTRALAARLVSRTFEGRAVFLFGHCNATEEAADYLSAHGIAVAAILDNSASKQGLEYHGIPIAPPERIRGFTADDSVVLIAARFFAQMSAQLRRLGYGGEIVELVDYNAAAEYSLSDETIARKYTRVRRGARALASVRAAYPGHHLIVCPNNALGDVYAAMAFLPAYREKRALGEVAVVAVGDACRQVAELFGARDIVALESADADAFVQALVFTREGNCTIAHHDRPYTDNIIKYLDKRFLSFIDYYRCAVYGLPRDAAPAVPTKSAPYDGTLRLVRGKTVILSPYAKSVTAPPAAFWEHIAERCGKAGLFVCTNVSGEEQPIAGTTPLNIPLKQIVSAAEYAGRFIGLRSGLCDILTTAKCRKTVVFPDCFYSTTPYKVEDFFALPGWEKIVHRTLANSLAYSI